MIECDGHGSHHSRESRTNDAQRDRFLKSEIYEVLRFTGTEICGDPFGCADQAMDAIIGHQVEDEE